jgi:ERF superfamily protein
MAAVPVKAGTPNLNKALSLLQGEMPKVTKTKTAEVKDQQTNRLLYKYDYADLGDVVADMGPLMARHGLAFHCGPTINPADRREMILVWSLLHESGEERSGEWPLGPVNQKPQSLGSAITYGRRYSFTAATNIVLEDDDDGQRAQKEHDSRQSAGDVFDNATPARPRKDSGDGNGQQRSREPKQPAAQAAEGAEGTDPEAQKFADEAHDARTPAEVEDIHRRAREDGKVTALVRSPASGGVGKLAIYLDWRRKQLMAAVRFDPDDPWAAKVDELASPEDAADAITELLALLGADKIDAARAGRIENAITAKFPGAGKENAVAS